MNTPQNGWMNQQQSSPGWANYGNPQGYYPQNPQPTPQQPVPQIPFTGRLIDDISEVVPNEVPMDGRAALFPNRSLEEIYLKMWNRDGQLKTFRYILDPAQNVNVQAPPPQEDTQTQMLQRIEELEAKLNGLTEKSTQKNSKGGEK